MLNHVFKIAELKSKLFRGLDGSVGWPDVDGAAAFQAVDQCSNPGLANIKHHAILSTVRLTISWH